MRTGEGVRSATLIGLLLLALPTAAAQSGDRVLLQEVLPALEGTELGALDVGPAPPPGSFRWLRRGQVLRAIRRAGRSAEGLAIPARTRIRRAVRVLDADALAALAAEPLGRAVAPCAVDEVLLRTGARVAEGPLEARVEARPPRQSGIAPGALVLTGAGRDVRVPLRARVTCPPPVVAPGQRLRALARSGPVLASVEVEARQGGRVGEVIRAQGPTGLLRVRIVDAGRGEVVR
jgi:hypothetical protein